MIPLTDVPTRPGSPGSEVVRPRDAPRGHAPGRDFDRVLLLGAGPAVGWGVATHELALPGALARAISARTKRGCDVDLIADPGMDVKDAAWVIAERDLVRYDALVLVVGVNEALKLTSVSKWRTGMSSLLSTLMEKLPIDSGIVVVGADPVRSLAGPGSGSGPLRQRRARALDRETIDLCAREQRTTFLSLPAPSTPSSVGHTTRGQYAQWATAMAETLAPQLSARNELNRDRRGSQPRPLRIVEAARQEAVDDLLRGHGTTSPDLQRVVVLAQQAFKVESALITVLDRDRQWHLARVGTDVEEIPRSVSFCEFAIQQNDALIVRDTREDARFRDNPLVVGEPHIRFYAGFPIESITGQRIGSVCVFDSHPRRRADDINATFLRELAHLAQRELWKSLPALIESTPFRGRPGPAEGDAARQRRTEAAEAVLLPSWFAAKNVAESPSPVLQFPIEAKSPYAQH